MIAWVSWICEPTSSAIIKVCKWVLKTDSSSFPPCSCSRKDLSYTSLFLCSAGSRAAVSLQSSESLLLAGQGGRLLPRHQLCGWSAASSHERRASLWNVEVPHVRPWLPEAVQARYDVTTGKAEERKSIWSKFLCWSNRWIWVHITHNESRLNPDWIQAVGLSHGMWLYLPLGVFE